MKQATGATNNLPDQSYVSIRLRLDGHSFSEDLLPSLSKSDLPVEIVVVTAKTMLVPGDIFDEQSATALLRLNGMSPTETETLIHTDPKAPIVAVMAVDRRAIDKIQAMLGARLHWTTPLLHTPQHTVGTCIRIFRHEELVFLTIWERTLRLAEVFTAPTSEDLLLYTTELTRALQLKEFDVQVEGSSVQQDSRILHTYFKHVTVCE